MPMNTGMPSLCGTQTQLIHMKWYIQLTTFISHNTSHFYRKHSHITFLEGLILGGVKVIDIQVSPEQIKYVESLLKKVNFGQRGDADGDYNMQRTGIIGQVVV